MSIKTSLPNLFLYNGARSQAKKYRKKESLNYLSSLNRNVNIQIPRFVSNLGHVPDRYLDLIELAAYVYCADRFTKRGEKDSVYFKGWSRQFKHVMRVRDYKFWNQKNVKELLSSLLSFMSGDDHCFQFQANHRTAIVDLFDHQECWPEEDRNCRVVMFSGGLDSTTGVLELLNSTNKTLLLASHITRPGTKTIIKNIKNELNERYPNRILSIPFECNLHGVRAKEETQRTRSFLYSAIGASIAKAYGENKLYYFENGVVSINLPPSEQLRNARASRTTHPKVLSQISKLISLIEERDFYIRNPFFWKTKTNILELIDHYKGRELLHKTVSCSRTFDKGVDYVNKSHCGRCSQCIDRRFAVAAAGLLEVEGSLPYAYDFVTDNICSDKTPTDNCEEKTTLVDFIRLCKTFKEDNVDSFQDRWIEPITDLIDHIEGDSESDKLERLYKLFNNHGSQVLRDGLKNIINYYHDNFYFNKTTKNSLIQILGKKDYLDEPPRILSERIYSILNKNLPIAFKSKKPSSELEVQDKIEALLSGHIESLNREFPHVSFALSKAVPDFSLSFPSVYIEVKYLRGKTSPSKVSAGIAEDCTKYPEEAFILFVNYDPERKVADDQAFSSEFEGKRPCMVRMIR